MMKIPLGGLWMIEMKGALFPEKTPVNAMQVLVHVELIIIFNWVPLRILSNDWTSLSNYCYCEELVNADR